MHSSTERINLNTINADEIKSEILIRLSLFKNLPIGAEISDDFSLFCLYQAEDIEELINILLAHFS
jgi:hypothetical protein